MAVQIAAADQGRPIQGQLTERRGRPRWVLPSPQPPGRVLTITVELPGFRLAENGDLAPAGTESTAPVVLLGQVRGCRFFPPANVYVLRLKLLGRVWPDG